MKIIVILVALSLFASCACVKKDVDQKIMDNQENIITPEIYMDSIKGAYLLIDKQRYDFGEIDRDKISLIPIEFELKNIGKSPLII